MKIGDKVRCIDPTHSKFNEVGILTVISKRDNTGKVYYENGSFVYFYPYNIEIVAEAHYTPTPKFKNCEMKSYFRILSMVLLITIITITFITIIVLFIWDKANYTNIIHLVILFILCLTTTIYLGNKFYDEGNT